MRRPRRRRKRRVRRRRRRQNGPTSCSSSGAAATIGPRGRQIVAEAARNAGGEQGNGRVELQAYADRSGRADRNQRLSERRADSVAAELVRLGVRRERITIRAYGENRAFVPTRDGEREAQNRGVWIVLR